MIILDIDKPERCGKCPMHHDGNDYCKLAHDHASFVRAKGCPIQTIKTGHWIADEVQLPDRVVLNYHCSVCGRKLVGYSTETLKDAPYCHCGARMSEVEQ